MAAEERSRVNRRVSIAHVDEYRFAFEAYGVKVRIETNNAEGLDFTMEAALDALPEFDQLPADSVTEHHLKLVWNRSGRHTLYRGKKIVAARQSPEVMFGILSREIRLTAAENAVERVFVHAGVVVWGGRAIVLPGDSFHGKSTLTAELVRRGAGYYSDEYAIFDPTGKVNPFPKSLSIRGEVDAYRQIDRPVEHFGGVQWTGGAVVGLVLLTQYQPRGKWDPQILSPANGLMEILKYTLPIRRRPAFTLAVLKTVADEALIVKTDRGDASEAARLIIKLMGQTARLDPDEVRR